LPIDAGNPIADSETYRNDVLATAVQLNKLDKQEFTDDEKTEAKEEAEARRLHELDEEEEEEDEKRMKLEEERRIRELEEEEEDDDDDDEVITSVCNVHCTAQRRSLKM
jgi:hypothetical protein